MKPPTGVTAAPGGSGTAQPSRPHDTTAHQAAVNWRTEIDIKIASIACCTCTYHYTIMCRHNGMFDQMLTQFKQGL